MIKLIASDLDGTLLDEPNYISKINRDAIEYAYQKGAKFCFATGRDLAAVKELSELLVHKPVLLLSNGAQILDENENLLHQDTLDNIYLKEIIEILHRHALPYMIFTTDGFYTTMPTNWVRQKFIDRIGMIRNKETAQSFANSSTKPCNNLVNIEDMDAFIESKQILKVEGFDTNSKTVDAVKKEFQKFTELSSLSTGKNNVEVTNSTATKGLALQKYCQIANIQPDEVMVLGDSHNDLSMFEHFPYSFAPENSIDEIKKQAYKIVKSCMDHGVSDAIYQFIK